MVVILSFLCAGFFVHHVTYLALVNFDYGYNMQANIVVGMLYVHCLYKVHIKDFINQMCAKNYHSVVLHIYLDSFVLSHQLLLMTQDKERLIGWLALPLSPPSPFFLGGGGIIFSGSA
jgi:hypothetical protein